jgi:hypothetical protein
MPIFSGPFGSKHPFSSKGIIIAIYSQICSTLSQIYNLGFFRWYCMVLHYNGGKVLYTTTKNILYVQFWLVLCFAHLLFVALVTIVIMIEHMVHKASLCVALALMQGLVRMKE